MSRLSTQLNEAQAHWDAGRVDDAERAARSVLTISPDEPDALRIAGLAAMRRNDLAGAVTALARVIAVRPNIAKDHANLAIVLTRLNRADEAIAEYEKSLALDPADAEVHNNLGVQLDIKARQAEAIVHYRRAIELRAEYGSPWLNLASALLQTNRPADALPAAIHAVRLSPRLASAHHYLGLALKELNQHKAAIDSLRTAAQMAPNNPQMRFHLADALAHEGVLDEAIENFEIVRKQNPKRSRVYYTLGFLLGAMGQVDDAIKMYRAGMVVSPNDPQLADNLLFILQFARNADARVLFAEHEAWASRFETPMARFRKPHENDRDPDRRLRIGYVSPDFRDHAQRFFMIPLLTNHDRAKFEIYLYCNTPQRDEFSEQIRKLADVWRDIVEVRDEEIAKRIREDRIDILVDLTMHMARNRLDVFAMKPAPVQVTWLAYPGTTGLRAIDYRLTDAVLDPPGTDAGKYSEQSIRLPDTFWCYDAQSTEPVNDLPAKTNGHVTFGSLNSFLKMNDAAIDLWSAVLNALPDSHMLLMAPVESARVRVRAGFARNGVNETRIEFVPRQPREDYLRTYHRIDIGLDTIPYNGHTTSLDSFWMGVPVITLVGSTIVGRAGLSQLTNLGMTELAARDRESFVKIAVEWSRDIPRLREMRRTLRARMQSSPLMEVSKFARSIEAIFRSIWRKWCEEKA